MMKNKMYELKGIIVMALSITVGCYAAAYFWLDGIKMFEIAEELVGNILEWVWKDAWYSFHGFSLGLKLVVTWMTAGTVCWYTIKGINSLIRVVIKRFMIMKNKVMNLKKKALVKI